MTIYRVTYLNNYGEEVANFGYYADKLDAEKRAFEVRMKVSLESGKVDIVDVFVHDCSVKEKTNNKKEGKKETVSSAEELPLDDVYDFKD